MKYMEDMQEDRDAESLFVMGKRVDSPLEEILQGETSLAEEPARGYNSEKDFVSLDAWRKGRKVRLFFYNKVIPLIPPEEKYALASQTRRASHSITLNIAEGYGRYHYKEGIPFYCIARGSIYELKDILIICWDMKIIGKDLFDTGWELLEDAKVTLNGFILYVQERQRSSKGKGK